MKKQFWILLLLFLVTGYSNAQVPFFEYYPLLKRNESVHVYVIFQDRLGFIWHGTNKGLFRFDGIRQERFTTTDSLPDEHVTAVAQDSLGRIWTGHKNGKIAYLVGTHFRSFDPPEGLSPNEISDILFDRKGNLWFSTLNDGLYYFTQERLYRIDEQEGLPDIYVYDMVEDRYGNIWAGTDGGAAICRLRDRKVTIQVLDYAHGLPDNIVKKLQVDKNNTVWMGTEDAGVVSFDPASGKTTTLIKEWKFGNLTDFSIEGEQVWISSPQSGLVLYDLKTSEAKLYNGNTGLDFMAVNTLLTDNEGNIWVGTKSGVIRTLGDHVEYIDRFDPFTNTSVLALTVDKDENIWFSTTEGLFRRSTDETGKPMVEQLLLKTPYQEYTTVSLYTDSAGYVWAGLYGEGVLRISPDARSVKYINKELRNGNVLSITGRGDVVWLATLGGGTRIKFSGEQLDVKNYGRKEGLVSDYIYQIFIDNQDRVWFATDGDGAGMLDKSGFHHYEEGLPSKVVYGFAQDGNDRIWLNVQGEGLFEFDGDSFQPLPKEAPLRDKNINCFSSDSYGNLVILHDLGIEIYDIAKKKVRYLGDEVGIRDMKPNLNALTKDFRGRIYVGTDHGIMRYSDRTYHTLTSPTLAIENLLVNDQAVALTPNLSFAYNENSVIIQYVGFWYQNPVSLTYQYRLENYNKDWIETHDRSATYSSLPPGKYTFVVRVSDTENFTDAAETRFSFEIAAPFWQAAWFYFLCGAVILGSAYGYVHYRERNLVRTKRILQKKVLERTREIQMRNEEIQAQNEEIQSQAEEIQGINDNLESLVKERTFELEKKNKAAEESAFIIAHELRAPVASVLGLINLISKCELNEEARTIVDHMEHSADKLNIVVRNITKAIEKGDH